MIGSSLKEVSDIKKLRLVHKAFSVAAAEFLLEEVYLVFKTDSFERLRQISSNAFFSKRVKSLRYEPDNFERLDYDRWAPLRRGAALDEGPKPPQRPSPEEGERARRGYQRTLDKFNAEEASEPQRLNYTYCRYVEYLKEQESIRCQDYNSALIRGVIARLPNLEVVTVNVDNGVLTQREVLGDAFEDCHRSL